MPRFSLIACMWLATLLAGCATTDHYERSLNALVGLQESELVQKLGRPNRTYDANGFRYLVYESRDIAFIPGTANGYQTMGQGVHERRMAIGGSPDVAIEATCITTFEIEQAKVIAWAHKGNYCKSAR